MIVPASGHQVRCIPWVQMGIFNKEIGFLCGLKFFALNIFCGEYLQSSLHLMLQNRYWERCANHKLCASKHTDLLNSCLGKLCLHPYLVVPLISARVTLTSTRVSAHCQTILLCRRTWWEKEISSIWIYVDGLVQYCGNSSVLAMELPVLCLATDAVNQQQTQRDTVIIISLPHSTGLILGLHPANERRRYKVTLSLTGWVQT